MTDAPIGDKNYRLSEEQLAALTPFGEMRAHAKGDVLFEEGARDVDLLVVLSGQLNVYLSELGERRRVGWLEPRQFTGDVGMITGHPALVSAEMDIPGDVLHVPVAAFRRLLVENADLSDAFVTTFAARRAWARLSERGSVILLGRALDRDSFALRDLLNKHDVPHLWVEADKDPAAQTIVDRLGLTLDDAPILITGERRLVRPTIEEVGRHLGLDLLADASHADVVVIGAGPAGLAASVYAASEGLDVVAIDAVAPGGQAGTSSKIENYLGFPSGISGRELAERARVQAQKFGARLAAPVRAAELARDGDDYVLTLRDGRTLRSRGVIIATGAEYRRLPIPDLEKYEGRGVYYGATAMEAQICQGSNVVIVGAGNSAGQGASFLARYARNVHILYRRADIRETMSEYLVRRLQETPNVHLHPGSEISRLLGCEDRLRKIAINGPDGEAELDASFAFLFIGAAPCGDWLDAAIARDAKGFIKTGPEIANIDLVKAGWSLDRMPTRYETAWPRVYAVGDVRSGSVKRVASSVGEGSIVIQALHAALAEIAQQGD
ncbi:MAG: cyclic nucleotide-binding domain-containing protein [Alphaproteobacteria bacterium]|nr:cyclic nucleotide-binding domain-containing protein [Alphaproteobacteria bacterium]